MANVNYIYTDNAPLHVVQWNWCMSISVLWLCYCRLP